SVNWTCTKCGTDRSPGFITRSGPVGVNSFIAHYRNMTDGPLRFVRMSYSVKQYYISNQGVNIDVSWSSDGTTWSSPVIGLNIANGDTDPDELPIDPNPHYLDT